MTLYMVIETFPEGPDPVYARFREKGRMLPDGLTYIDSWVSEDMTTCFQVMETDDITLLEAWQRRWNDLVDFDVIPIRTSADAQTRVPVSSPERT